MSKVGIYAGTFDPVHVGHISFALQAREAAQLDKVYFLPERRPAAKQGVEHFGHRVAMLQRASQPHPDFGVIELPDLKFTVKRTLPQLRKLFPEDQLVFLFGSDVAEKIADWPHVENLLQSCELVIGVRSQDDKQQLRDLISGWQTQPKLVTIFDSFAADVSSGSVREALQSRKSTKGLLKSVERYSDHHWLYVSLSKTS